MNGGVKSNLVPMFKYSSWVHFLVRRKDTMTLIESGSLISFSLKYTEWCLVVGFIVMNLGCSFTFSKASLMINGYSRLCFVSFSCSPFLIITISTLPVNSHSYAISASTTSIVFDPNAGVNPLTLTFLSCVLTIKASEPTTGEYTRLSSSRIEDYPPD